MLQFMLRRLKAGLINAIPYCCIKDVKDDDFMIVNMDYSLSKITEEIINKFRPTKIVLFGSVAKGIYSENSDIDLCIIKDTDDKRLLTSSIYTEIDCDIPFDIIVYTLEEWDKNINDLSSFAYLINKSGVVLYG